MNFLPFILIPVSKCTLQFFMQIYTPPPPFFLKKQKWGYNQFCNFLFKINCQNYFSVSWLYVCLILQCLRSVPWFGCIYLPIFFSVDTSTFFDTSLCSCVSISLRQIPGVHFMFLVAAGGLYLDFTFLYPTWIILDFTEGRMQEYWNR